MAFTTSADCIHNSLGIFIQHSARSSAAYERTEQAHYLNVILLRVFACQMSQSIDATNSDCEDLAAEHLGSLLETVVQ